MKLCIVILALTLAVSASAHQPLSEELISFVNENAATWTAAKNKFHSLPFKAVKQMLGVPLEHIGQKSRLPKRVHLVGDIPAQFDARTAWPNCPSIQEVFVESSLRYAF